MRQALPFLMPEDLGIDLEEDSEDFTDLEAGTAMETASMEDFVAKMMVFLRTLPEASPKYELRRRAGILYCRVLVEGTDANRVFRLPWLQRQA